MTPKISVIVPVYKAEAYLHRCLDSLLAQTFTDYEVLLVDDGSPDHSGEICDAYAARDSRIKVFHKENGGVSSARQYGMERAQGEYTIHADPDDWIEPDMLAELYREAIEENADMVICDFFENKKEEELYRVQKPSSLEPDAVLRQLLGQQLLGACWNKLLRRQLVQDFGIRFPLDVILWEDLLVNCLFLTHEVKVAYLPKAFYHYDVGINEHSLIKKPLKEILMQEQVLYRLLEKKLPAPYFQCIKLKMLPHMAYKALCIGSPYLKTFKLDYDALRPCIGKLDIAFQLKLILILSYKMSPGIVHVILRIKHCFR